jgi:hypothetical protein
MDPNAAQWFYVGHYGQLGPLTGEQIEELVRDGVVAADTFVWQPGMSQWQHASLVPALRPLFDSAPTVLAPPPMPPMTGAGAVAPYGSWQPAVPSHVPLSDKNRVLAGLLQLLIPGVGRMYLGYTAYGFLQLFLTPCGFLIGWIWSVIDGIVILTGGLKYDGYGRSLPE